MNNIDKFKAFLIESGAEILKPTNPYEIVRFKNVNGVSVVYTGKRGWSFTGDAAEAYDKFQKRNIWQIKRRDEKELERIKAEILTRDGCYCFYCNRVTKDGEDRTVEHILSITHGGNNNLANLAFACHDCNQAVGNMAIIEKIKYRETLRGQQ